MTPQKRLVNHDRWTFICSSVRFPLPKEGLLPVHLSGLHCLENVTCSSVWSPLPRKGPVTCSSVESPASEGLSAIFSRGHSPLVQWQCGRDSQTLKEPRTYFEEDNCKTEREGEIERTMGRFNKQYKHLIEMARQKWKSSNALKWMIHWIRNKICRTRIRSNCGVNRKQRFKRIWRLPRKVFDAWLGT